MFLEILTLVVLVVLIKYVTSKHLGSLNQEKLEL